jgi:excisionase family DNA binding protein
VRRQALEPRTVALSVEEAAERLGTSVRFVRRLVYERRIAFTKLGHHMRIAASDLDAFIKAGRVEAGSITAYRQGRSHGLHREAHPQRKGQLPGAPSRPERSSARQDLPPQGRRGEYVALIEAAKLRGTWTDPAHGKITLAEWLETWWRSAADLRPSTKARDRAYLNSLVLPRFGTTPLAAITQPEAQAWVTELSARGFAPATVVKAYQLLGRTLTAAVNADMIARSPCRAVRLPKIERDEMRFLTPAEVAHLTDAINPRYRALVLLGAYGGLRMGGAGRPPGPGRPGRRLRVHRRPGRAAAHLEPPGQGVAPCRPRGRPGTVAAARPSPHRGCLLDRRRRQPKEVSVRAGHTSVSFTLDRYGHLFPGHDAELRERLDAMHAQGRQAAINRRAIEPPSRD